MPIIDASSAVDGSRDRIRTVQNPQPERANRTWDLTCLTRQTLVLQALV